MKKIQNHCTLLYRCGGCNSDVHGGSVFCHAKGPCEGSPGHRMSLKTSFDSKQPKLEQKLVSALSETKRLFRLFRFYTEMESFSVSIEPKQTEEFDREHILLFFSENLGLFWFVSKQFVSIDLLLYRNREFRYFD